MSADPSDNMADSTSTPPQLLQLQRFASLRFPVVDPSKQSIRSHRLADVDWHSVPLESWVAEYRMYIKVLTHQWAANLYRGWKIFERDKKLHYRDAKALLAQLYEFWQCWKVFGTLRSPDREAFLASPAFHPIENAIPHLAPKKVDVHMKDEMMDLRYRARLLVGAFLIARAVVVEVDERMLEHASTPFVYIPSPQLSLPSEFPEIDEVDSILKPAWLQQDTNEDDAEGVEEKDEQQDARSGQYEEFVKQSKESVSVSENAEPVARMSKGNGKEVRKDD